MRGWGGDGGHRRDEHGSLKGQLSLGRDKMFLFSSTGEDFFSSLPDLLNCLIKKKKIKKEQERKREIKRDREMPTTHTGNMFLLFILFFSVFV